MTSRRVLFDGYWLGDGPPSGRNVVFGLSSGWAQAFPEDDVVLTYPDRFADVALPAGVAIQPVRSRVTNHGLWTMARLGQEAKGFDAVISQNFTPLFGSNGATRATFLHDAMYQERPEWFTRPERAYLSLASAGLSRAHHVITSSLAERTRIERASPAVAGRVHAVGLAAPIGLVQANSRLEPTADPGRPFVLAVGRLNVRKNLVRLLEGFSSSGLTETHDLRIVGEPDGRSTSYGRHAHVQFLGGVDNVDLADLYRSCDFFAFPSLDEGFGLPLVEASHFGTPSMASDIPPFREIGVAEVLFDPTDAAAIGSALRAMATTYGRLARSTPMALTHLSWLAVAQRTRSALFG